MLDQLCDNCHPARLAPVEFHLIGPCVTPIDVIENLRPQCQLWLVGHINSHHHIGLVRPATAGGAETVEPLEVHEYLADIDRPYIQPPIDSTVFKDTDASAFG